jgi:hypothetical protein
VDQKDWKKKELILEDQKKESVESGGSEGRAEECVEMGVSEGREDE